MSNTKIDAKAFNLIGLIGLFLTILLLPNIVLTHFVNAHVVAKLAILTTGIVLILAAKISKTLITRRIEFTTSHFDIPVFLFALAYTISGVLRTPNKIDALFLPGTLTFVVGGAILYFTITQLQSRTKNLLLAVLIFSGVITNLIFILSILGAFKSIGFAPAYLKSTFTPFDGILGQTVFNLTLIVAILSQIALKPRLGIRGLLLGCLTLFVIGTYFSIIKILPGKEFAPQMLSFKDSWVIAIDSIKDQPLLGAGPGNFVSAFTRFKTMAFNQTTQWNTLQFTSRNLYFTIATEIGLMGVFLITLFSLYWIKALKSESNPAVIATLALLALLLIFPPTPSLLVLLFVLLGLASQDKTTIKIENKVAIFVLCLPTAAVLGLLVFFGGSALAAEAHYKTALTTKDNQIIYSELAKAIRLSPHTDRYRISFAQTNINLAALLIKKGELNEDEKSTLNQLVTQGINHGKVAVSLNPERSGNWEVLAKIYQSFVRVAQDAEEFTLASYRQAISLDPYNPLLRLSLGGFYYSIGNFQEATRILEMAVSIKPDYPNTRYNLALAYKEAKNLKGAIEQLNQVLTLVEKDSADYELAKTTLEQLKNEQAKLPQPEGSSLTIPQSPNTKPVTSKIQLPQESAPPVFITPTPTSTPTPSI